MKKGKSFPLRPLAEDPLQLTVDNIVQQADLLEWILEQTGPAEVMQTTFSVSEEYLRRLYFIRQKGNIETMTVITDNKSTEKTLTLIPFLRHTVENVYLAQNHSKMMLVIPKRGKPVAVVTSQNLSRGNRYESHIVTTDTAIVSTMSEAFDDIIDLHSVPIHELYR